MKYYNRRIYKLKLILIFFIGLTMCSCEWIFSFKEDEVGDYHHKISVTRLFCDSVGNSTFHCYYDSQNRLLKSVNTLPDGHNIYELEAVYKGNIIGIGEYSYTLDSQNRVVHIVHHSDEYTYEFDGNLLSKETYQAAGENSYTSYYFYENGKLVSDSVISGNLTSVTQHNFSDILRPDFMISEVRGFGLYELKPVSAYLEESSTSKSYYEGRQTLNVTTVTYNYTILDNSIVCNALWVETPKVSDNCMEYQITWTREENP